METRKITVVSTANQKKVVVETAATTLAELKEALNGVGVVYDGMSFYEGLSHTELLTDDAILPHDVPYKGETTNELVFMLTNSNKKIRSGAGDARVALYATIREKSLEDVVKELFGKNFTNCTNEELLKAIEEGAVDTSVCNCRASKAVERLIDILWDNDCISTEERNEVIDILDLKDVAVEAPKSKYSDDEIDEMFSTIA